jgi:hypothetical protein
MTTEDERSMLESERARIFSSDDRDLYLHVGYFFVWYNTVEWQITNIMAMVMGERDIASFNLLVSGLDGGTKVRRFKRLCKIKKWTIEQSLLDRLGHFEGTICRLRNRLAHSPLARNETSPGFFLMQLHRLPWKAFGMEVPPGELSQPPEHIDSMALFEHGYWLHNFSGDLAQVTDCAIKRRPLGIKSPRSPSPSSAQSTSSDDKEN